MEKDPTKFFNPHQDGDNMSTADQPEGDPTHTRGAGNKAFPQEDTDAVKNPSGRA